MINYIAGYIFFSLAIQTWLRGKSHYNHFFEIMKYFLTVYIHMSYGLHIELT